MVEFDRNMPLEHAQQFVLHSIIEDYQNGPDLIDSHLQRASEKYNSELLSEFNEVLQLGMVATLAKHGIIPTETRQSELEEHGFWGSIFASDTKPHLNIMAQLVIDAVTKQGLSPQEATALYTGKATFSEVYTKEAIKKQTSKVATMPAMNKSFEQMDPTSIAWHVFALEPDEPNRFQALATHILHEGIDPITRQPILQEQREARIQEIWDQREQLAEEHRANGRELWGAVLAANSENRPPVFEILNVRQGGDGGMNR